MSEKIQVVVQLNNSKRVIRFEYQTGLPFFACLSENLAREGVAFSLCGGKGICGKCRIRFTSGVPLPTNAERQFLSAEELRQGIRLACLTKPVRDCVIDVLFEQYTTVVTGFGLEKSVDTSDTFETEYVITADVGTTTIAMALVELHSGKVLKTYSCMNPQSVYGSDVIARIRAAGEVGADKLQKAVVSALIVGAKELAEGLADKMLMAEQNVSVAVKTIYVAANTVMSHFLAGSDAAGLGKAPFEPEFLNGKEVEVDGYRFILVPGVSAFVGGDIVAGMLGCKMMSFSNRRVPNRSQEVLHQVELKNVELIKGILFIDLGTNGEMALCNGKKVYCTAAAAGPAFEGKDSKKRGSHSVNILAELLKSGQMDATGFLHKVVSDEEKNKTKELDCSLTQNEIRDLQMAKAAVRTGIEVLLEKAGMYSTDIKQVYIAGGFGYYIAVEDAVAIGLLPADFAHITTSVGNAALHGTALYARLAQSGENDKLEQSIRENCISVNLAEEEYFIENYIEQMDFPI